MADPDWRPAGLGLRIEAALLLTLAAVLIRVAPFRRLASLAARRMGPRRNGRADLLVGQVKGVVTGAGRRAPWSSSCFEEGLAAQVMLRRRGVDARLHYGAAVSAGVGLNAHVWVTAEGFDVVGCEMAGEFSPLAQFPDGPPVR